jgi:hypothetical protein
VWSKCMVEVGRAFASELQMLLLIMADRDMSCPDKH